MSSFPRSSLNHSSAIAESRQLPGKWTIERHANRIALFILALGVCWRLWLAHATYFNTDEAWHFLVANQSSLLAVYRASLTLAHPPLLVVILHFWKHLGTSDLMLRLPGVLAGTTFCWVIYKWLGRLFGQPVALAGLVFASLLPPMIALTAELRQYSLMLMFAITAAYVLEQAYAEDSARWMAFSFVSLYLAMLSHYSAFLFAAALGVYEVARMLHRRFSNQLIVTWFSGQGAGVLLAAFLYRVHISKLGSVYPGDPLRRFGDFYLSEVYFHAGKENLAHFLYRGTFGVFRFMCGQRTAGHLTTLLFLLSIVLFFRKSDSKYSLQGRTIAILLAAPFLVSWIAVLAGLYPYGRTRQCIFLAIFGIGGVSIALACLARNRAAVAISMAIAIVAISHIFGVSHTLDMRAIPEQKAEHMQKALEFLERNATPDSLVFTDQPTSFQLARYLCPGPVDLISRGNEFESYRCAGLQIVSTNLVEGSLTPETFPLKLSQVEQEFHTNPETPIWVIQAAWSRGLGEGLRTSSAAFSGIQPRSFDYYIEVFEIPRSRQLAPMQAGMV